ncbi:MAG: hypothetical protein AAGN35_19870 [Bacteroidota bacterium]
MKPNFVLRSAWRFGLCLMLGAMFAFPASAQFRIESDPMTHSLRAVSDSGLNPDHYNFTWIFADDHFEMGPSVTFMRPNGISNPVVTQLFASKRYDDDDDPNERVADTLDLGATFGPSRIEIDLSRNPRKGFESIFHLQLGSKYPVYALITYDPQFTVREFTDGPTCYPQYSDQFAPGNPPGNYRMDKKQHDGLAANQELYFISDLSSSLGPNRADLLVPVCVPNPEGFSARGGVRMGDSLVIKVAIFLADTNRTAAVMQNTDLTNVAAELPDLWGNTLPQEDSIKRVVVSSWDPNSKGAEPDSVAAPGKFIRYFIHYENIGNAMENTVKVYDTLPEEVEPNLYDIEWSNATTVDLSNQDGDPRTLEYEISDVLPGEGGFIAFKVDVRPDVPFGKVIRNRARILFSDAGQDTLTNLTYNRVVDPERGDVTSGEDCCKNPCEYCKEKDDCPNWLRPLLGVLILLVLLLLVLWVRALQRIRALQNGGN